MIQLEVLSCCFFSIQHSDEIARRARDVGAKFVLTDELRAGRVLDALASVDCVDEVLVIGQYRGCTPFDDLLQQPADGLLSFHFFRRRRRRR